jgi:hypothetical protein
VDFSCVVGKLPNFDGQTSGPKGDLLRLKLPLCAGGERLFCYPAQLIVSLKLRSANILESIRFKFQPGRGIGLE